MAVVLVVVGKIITGGRAETENPKTSGLNAVTPNELAESRAHNDELTLLNIELSQEVSSIREEVNKLRGQLGRESILMRCGR